MTALVIAMFWAMTVQAQESQDSIESVNKAAIEREQNDARISSAEREQAQQEVKLVALQEVVIKGGLPNTRLSGTYRVYCDKPRYTLNAFNTFTLNHGWQFDINLMYRSKGYSYNFYNDTYNLRLGLVAQKSLLKERSLTLRCAVLDCLQRNRVNESGDLGYNQFRQCNRFSTHKLFLSLVYRLNATRSKYKGTGAGKAVIERMQ